MAIFAIIKQPSPDPTRLEAVIKAKFPTGHYALSDSAWLIAARGTAVEVSAQLGLGPTPELTAVVIEVGSYYGRANPAIWTWIKTNWEASSG
jgi:hypothetical protein